MYNLLLAGSAAASAAAAQVAQKSSEMNWPEAFYGVGFMISMAIVIIVAIKNM